MVRVMRRDGLGEEEVRRRMGAQPTAQEYVSHANVVICTQWDYSVTQKQVCAWCRCLHVFGSILCVCILCVCLRVCVFCVCVWPACVYVYVFSRANSLSLTHTQPHGSMSICVSDRLLGEKSNFM